MNHNLPDYDYQGIRPFSNDREPPSKQEESKVGNMRMSSSNDIHNSQFAQFNRISNYSKAVEQLGDLNLVENESNLFGDENSAKTDHKSEEENIDEGIEFLKKLVQLKDNPSSKKNSENLFAMISQNKVTVK